MAIYHLSSQIIGRSKGRSCVAAAAYRSGQCLINEREDRLADFSNRKGVAHAEIVAPENAPDWATDREQLWNEVDRAEKRKDAQTAREINLALPRELSAEKQADFMRDFCRDQFVSRGMIADFAIHEDKENHNPHAHIMLTTREVSAEGFGKKQRDWNSREQLTSWREAWGQHVNKALERENSAERVDHRTLKAQGVDHEPTIHEGPAGFHAKTTALTRRKPLVRLSKLGQPREVNYSRTDSTNRRSHNKRVRQKRAQKDRKSQQGQTEAQKRAEQLKRIRAAAQELRGRFSKRYAEPRAAEARFIRRARSHGLRAAYSTLDRDPKKFGELARAKPTRQRKTAAPKHWAEKTRRGRDEGRER